MNVLHISISSPKGGAAIGARRLHECLRGIGVNSRLLQAGLAKGGESEHIGGWRNLSLAERLVGKITWRAGLNDVNAFRTSSLADHPWFQEAEVIHLHNLHGGSFSYLALPALAKRKPLIWTLHDMWPITGHCGFSLGCDRWRIGCGHCPHLEVYPYAARDATRWEWRLKRGAIAKACPILAAPSRWLCGLAAEAFPALSPVEHVPYSIDTATFFPRSQAEARAALGLPVDRVLLLSAASDLSEKRKGGHLLGEALRGVSDEQLRHAAIVTLGNGAGPWMDELRSRGVPVFALGFVCEAERLALVYSAADLLLFPSMDDNLPIVVLEALACGLPTLAFGVGGLPELVSTPAQGCAVPAFDIAAYSDAICRAICPVPPAAPLRASLLSGNSERQQEASAYGKIYNNALAGRSADPDGKHRS